MTRLSWCSTVSNDSQLALGCAQRQGRAHLLHGPEDARRGGPGKRYVLHCAERWPRRRGLPPREAIREPHLSVWKATGGDPMTGGSRTTPSSTATEAEISRSYASDRAKSCRSGTSTSPRLTASCGRAAATRVSRPSVRSSRRSTRRGSTHRVRPPDARVLALGHRVAGVLEIARDEYPLLGPEEFDVEPDLPAPGGLADPIGLCKRGDLLNLQRERFEGDWWKGVRRIGCSGDAAGRVRRANPTLAPVRSPLSIAVRRNHISRAWGPAEGPGWEKLRRWFWCSYVSPAIRRSVKHLNAADYRQLSEWLRDDENVPARASTTSGSMMINLRSTETQQRTRSTVDHVPDNREWRPRLLHGKPTAPRTHSRTQVRQIEDHHLAPTGFIRACRPRARENSILNRALIDYRRTIGSSGRRPHRTTWVRSQTVGDEQLEEILASHLIPYEGPGRLGKRRSRRKP